MAQDDHVGARRAPDAVPFDLDEARSWPAEHRPQGRCLTVRLHRSSSPQPDSLLHDAAAELSWPGGRVDVFAHGEAAEIRAVRRHLLAERGVERDLASISPYWRRAHTDEARGRSSANGSTTGTRRLTTLATGGHGGVTCGPPEHPQPQGTPG